MQRVRIAGWVAALALTAVAQPPLQLNTTVRSFTTVSATPWVADIWAFTDNLGRDFALVCRGNSGLSCYEITNPDAPVFASSIAATGSDLKDVKVYGNYAYALQQSGGTLVVDISNPYGMVVVNTIAGTAHNGFFYTTGPVPLYLQSRNGANPANLRIYDVTNPATPVFLSAWEPPSNGDTHDCWAQDGYVYVNVLLGADNTYVLDISNPSNPVQVAIIPSGAWSHSSWGYNAPGGSTFLVECNETAGGHALIYDVTDPINPTYVSEYVTPTSASISIHNPIVVGRYCYIAWYADYLRILDMARPAAPVEVGTFDPNPTNAGAGVFDGAWGCAYVKEIPGGHRLVLTESFATVRGFWVIDFTPPPVPEMDISTTGLGDLSFSVTGVAPGTLIANAVSTVTTGPLGAGGVGGVGGDALFALTLPIGTAPYWVFADGTGSYSLNLPPGSAPPGLSVDVVTFGQTTPGTWSTSAVGRVTF